MSLKHRVFIVEDHTIVREGLKLLLTTSGDYEVVGEAGDGREAIKAVGHCTPDLVIIDLSMPGMNGMEAIREIRKIVPRTKILVLTIHDSEEYILPVLRAGADGYALKSETHSGLLSAIKNVMAGGSYLSPGVARKVIQGYVEGTRTLKTRSSWDTLTSREREVLKLIAEGHTSREIAQILGISVKTVVKHRANIMEKLDLHKVSALTAFAIEKGLVSKG